MERRRVAENNSEELFTYARRYLSTAFPNPNRDGCPVDASLRALAVDPRTVDPAIGEHISCCSPCFTRYMEILSEQRSAASMRARNWALSPVAWIAAILFIAVFIAIYVGFRSIMATKRSNGGQAYTRLVTNLEPFSSSRAPTEGQQPANPVLILPRRPIDLVLELPVGSEEGNYKVSLNSAEKSLWSAVIATRLSDQKL